MVTFEVGDMTCGRCAALVARAVKAVDPQAELGFDVKSRLVWIDGTTDAAEYAAAIREAGFVPGAP